MLTLAVIFFSIIFLYRVNEIFAVIGEEMHVGLS